MTLSSILAARAYSSGSCPLLPKDAQPLERWCDHGNLVDVAVVLQVVIVVYEILFHDQFRAAQLVEVVVLSIFFIYVLPLIRDDLLSTSPSRSDAGRYLGVPEAWTLVYGLKGVVLCIDMVRVHKGANSQAVQSSKASDPRRGIQLTSQNATKSHTVLGGTKVPANTVIHICLLLSNEKLEF